MLNLPCKNIRQMHFNLLWNHAESYLMWFFLHYINKLFAHEQLIQLFSLSGRPRIWTVYFSSIPLSFSCLILFCFWSSIVQNQLFFPSQPTHWFLLGSFMSLVFLINISKSQLLWLFWIIEAHLHFNSTPLKLYRFHIKHQLTFSFLCLRTV